MTPKAHTNYTAVATSVELESTDTSTTKQGSAFFKAPSGVVALLLIVLVYFLEILACTRMILYDPWSQETQEHIQAWFLSRSYFTGPDKILWTVAIIVCFILLCCLGIYVKCFRGNVNKENKEPQSSVACNESPPPMQDCHDTDGGETANVLSTPDCVPRSIAMDLVKVIMIFFVLALHSAVGTLMNLGDHGARLVHMSPKDSVVTRPLLIIVLPIVLGGMPIFFFISGLYTMSSFNRKGCVEFLIQKLQRLLLPTIDCCHVSTLSIGSLSAQFYT